MARSRKNLKAKPASQLSAGASSIKLSTVLKAGTLNVDAQEFTNQGDRTVVARASIGRSDLYRAFFSHDDDTTVFAVISDNGITTRVSLQDHPKRASVGIVNIWNDGAAEQSFDINIKKFMKTRDPKASVITSRGAPLDLVGKRKPPAITSAEIVKAFANTGAFRGFMRGEEHHESILARSRGGVNWKCAWICLIPACGLSCLFWKPNKKPKPPVAKPT